jgi:anti-sigma factor RsiW
MDELRPLSDEERSELIAYLDGELDGPATRAMEAKLSREPRVRAEADAMRRTWDMLDHLPRPEPTQEFTQRTIQSISALRPVVVGSGRWRWWIGGTSWAAGLLLAGAAGYGAVVWLTPKPPNEDSLVRDLRIIENKHYYDLVDDLDFLRDLDDPDRFGDDNLES